jgi:hypothetical protein
MARRPLPLAVTSCKACGSSTYTAATSSSYMDEQVSSRMDSAISLAAAVMCSCRCLEWQVPALEEPGTAVDAAVTVCPRGCRKEYDEELQQQSLSGCSIARGIQPVLS